MSERTADREREVTPCYLALEVRENADRLGVDSVLVFKFRSSSDGGFCGLKPVFVQLVSVTYFRLSDVNKPDLICDN